MEACSAGYKLGSCVEWKGFWRDPQHALTSVRPIQSTAEINWWKAIQHGHTLAAGFQGCYEDLKSVIHSSPQEDMVYELSSLIGWANQSMYPRLWAARVDRKPLSILDGSASGVWRACPTRKPNAVTRAAYSVCTCEKTFLPLTLNSSRSSDGKIASVQDTNTYPHLENLNN